MECAIGELGLDGFVERTNELIAEFGHSVIGVSDNPTFSYTVGRWQRGLPEVIVFGINPQIATVLINDLLSWDELPPFDTRFPNLLRGLDAKLRLVDSRYGDQYLCAAGQFGNSNSREIWQLLLPDTNNVFPDEDGFEEKFVATMPLLDRGTI